MTPKRAHRMIDEIYKKSKLDDRIHHPLSYALYEVWKLSEYDDVKKERREEGWKNEMASGMSNV